MSPNVVVCVPDARLRSLFSLLLTDVGAHVASCPDAEEVQRVLSSRFCQLCVLGQHGFPNLPGLIAAIRRLSPDTRVLLLADREEVDAVLPLFSQGLNDALLLPINPRRALDSIHKLLGTRQPDTATPFAGQVQADADYRPHHVVARSAAMRATIGELWRARQEPMGILLRGEAGTEFELIAREYQLMCGDPTGYLVVMSHQEVTTEGLATASSLDRLNDGVPRTFFLPDIERLPQVQQDGLLDFLRLARRRRDRDRPLRMVFAASESDASGQSVECPFLEELLFLLPTAVRVPPLRDRREDIEALARKVLLDLTAVFPAYRVRSLHPAVVEWLSRRLWRGNHHEFCGLVRKAVMDCTSRELNVMHFGTLPEMEPTDPDEIAAARVLATVQGLAPG